MDTAIQQLRQHEKEVWVRNRDRRHVEPQAEQAQTVHTGINKKTPGWGSWIASCVYTVYTWAFYCRRGMLNALFHDETKERQKLILEIPLPKHPWMCVI